MEEKKTNSMLGKIIGGIVLLIVVISLISSANKDKENREYFLNAINSRFDFIKDSLPELEKISCSDDTCITKEINFYFKELPKDIDIETVMRGQTATLSKFKMDNRSGSSEVNIVAYFSGKIIYNCTAYGGMVQSCN